MCYYGYSFGPIYRFLFKHKGFTNYTTVDTSHNDKQQRRHVRQSREERRKFFFKYEELARVHLLTNDLYSVFVSISAPIISVEQIKKVTYHADIVCTTRWLGHSRTSLIGVKVLAHPLSPFPTKSSPGEYRTPNKFVTRTRSSWRTRCGHLHAHGKRKTELSPCEVLLGSMSRHHLASPPCGSHDNKDRKKSCRRNDLWTFCKLKDLSLRCTQAADDVDDDVGGTRM